MHAFDIFTPEKSEWKCYQHNISIFLDWESCEQVENGVYSRTWVSALVRNFNKWFCPVCLGIANHLLLFAYYELFNLGKKANGNIPKLDMCTVLQKF